MKKHDRLCLIGTASVTYAMKAENILFSYGIASSIVRSNSAGGCAYALSLDCERLSDASAILARHGIPTRVMER